MILALHIRLGERDSLRTKEPIKILLLAKANSLFHGPRQLLAQLLKRLIWRQIKAIEAMKESVPQQPKG